MKAALLVWCLGALPVAAEGCRYDLLDARGAFGHARFTVEIADDDSERSRGLMDRDSLAEFAGMLFVYDAPQEASFWMKNTLLPLDMLFIDATGRVAEVHANAVPGDLTPIRSAAPARAVLEIRGGLAARLGIGPGTELRHPVFAAGPAAWPCDAN